MSPNQRNKIKNKLLPLARHVIYILSYDQDSSSFSTSSFDLPLIFLSLFFFFPLPLHISHFILEFLFPLSLCNHFSFSTRTKISPPHELSLTNSKCGRSIQASEKFVSKPFYTFLDIFTYFIYTREAGRRENSGERKCSTANT